MKNWMKLVMIKIGMEISISTRRKKLYHMIDAIILPKILTLTNTSIEMKSIISTGPKTCAISVVTSPSKGILIGENVDYGVSMAKIKHSNQKRKI